MGGIFIRDTVIPDGMLRVLMEMPIGGIIGFCKEPFIKTGRWAKTERKGNDETKRRNMEKSLENRTFESFVALKRYYGHLLSELRLDGKLNGKRIFFRRREIAERIGNIVNDCSRALESFRKGRFLVAIDILTTIRKQEDPLRPKIVRGVTTPESGPRMVFDPGRVATCDPDVACDFLKTLETKLRKSIICGPTEERSVAV